MKVIGVSGQTGAGKSTLADMLSKAGFGCNLEVDSIGHFLLEDEKIRELLVEGFGGDILDSEGLICRKALGRKAFKDPATTELLNSIMHPAMVERVKSELTNAKRRNEAYFIVNAALLFSMKLAQLCDELIYVVTSPEIRFSRLVENRNWSEESARERLFAQDEMPAEQSNIIIVRNDGTEEDLALEVEKIAIKLRCNERNMN